MMRDLKELVGDRMRRDVSAENKKRNGRLVLQEGHAWVTRITSSSIYTSILASWVVSFRDRVGGKIMKDSVLVKKDMLKC